MKSLNYDILVVGAGPAGASAAAEAARRNMRVLMVERRRTVGTPVQCAECIPALLVGEVNLGRRFVVQPVHSIKTFLAFREINKIRFPAFIIRRDDFDQTLAENACNQGAQLLLSTKAVARQKDGVLLRDKNGELSLISAKVIIGADGPHSTVGQWIGSVNRNLIPAVQVSVPLVRPLEFLEIYFDSDIYGGYAWLFPKGSQANLGLAMRKKGHQSPPFGKMFDKLILQLERTETIKAEPHGCISGWLPAESPRKIVHNNTLLVGDAAGHTHPVTGGGILQAVSCGRMAGKWAARAIEAGDLDLLSQYEEEYRDLWEDTLERAFCRRQFMEKKWDKLDKILKYCWVTFKEYYAEIK